MLYILQPRLTLGKESFSVECPLVIDGKSYNLWFEFEGVPHDYLDLSADGFLCAALPFAMRNGLDIEIRSRVSQSIVQKLTETYIPLAAKADNRIWQSKIHIGSMDADYAVTPLKKEGIRGAVATGMSCGVDSFYALMQNSGPATNLSPSLTHLYIGNYLYGNSSAVYERAAKVSTDINLPLIQSRTNLSAVLPMNHLGTHFFKTLSGVLLLKGFIEAYYYSSANPWNFFSLSPHLSKDTAEYELLLLYCFSDDKLQLYSSGGGKTRLEKTSDISNQPIVQNFLNVCLSPELEVNCSRCSKCVRTMSSLDMLGHLEHFYRVFDVESYEREKSVLFKDVVSGKDSTHFKEIYDFFKSTDPDLIASASRLVDTKKSRSRN